MPGSTVLSIAAARSLFKLMAIKDEYEVARLYTDGSFARQLGAEFASFDKLEFHLAPPILGRKGSDGLPRKSSFGPWMMTGFRVLSKIKALRGTPLDIFGYSAHRRFERSLIGQFEADLDLICRELQPHRLDAAVALASVPMTIRGYGHIKEANAERAAAERTRLVERFLAEIPTSQLQAAE